MAQAFEIDLRVLSQSLFEQVYTAIRVEKIGMNVMRNVIFATGMVSLPRLICDNGF